MIEIRCRCGHKNYAYNFIGRFRDDNPLWQCPDCRKVFRSGTNQAPVTRREIVAALRNPTEIDIFTAW